MKEAWFDYVVNNKALWCNGFTIKRLEKVRDAVLLDKYIMSELLQRHEGNMYLPEQMKSHYIVMFNHCIGNFTCSIFQKMIELEII